MVVFFSFPCSCGASHGRKNVSPATRLNWLKEGEQVKETRIMWIERKDGLAGPARIGRVTFSKSRKSLHYDGKTFHTLAGRGFKTNYVDVETGEEYWISGCHKDGRDALYTTDVEVDEDVCAWNIGRRSEGNRTRCESRASEQSANANEVTSGIGWNVLRQA
jgi:hypothetical protein